MISAPGLCLHPFDSALGSNPSAMTAYLVLCRRLYSGCSSLQPSTLASTTRGAYITLYQIQGLLSIQNCQRRPDDRVLDDYMGRC